MLDLETLTCPTRVIGADPTLPYAYLLNLDLGHAAAVDYDFVPDAKHLLQLEKPVQCAEMLRDLLDKNDIPYCETLAWWRHTSPYPAVPEFRGQSSMPTSRRINSPPR